METYEAMRQFADSWGLVGMMLFFLAAAVSTMLPGAREAARNAAQIPLNDIDAKPAACCGTCDGTGPCRRVANILEEEPAHG